MIFDAMRIAVIPPPRPHQRSDESFSSQPGHPFICYEYEWMTESESEWMNELFDSQGIKEEIKMKNSLNWLNELIISILRLMADVNVMIIHPSAMWMSVQMRSAFSASFKMKLIIEFNFISTHTRPLFTDESLMSGLTLWSWTDVWWGQASKHPKGNAEGRRGWEEVCDVSSSVG